MKKLLTILCVLTFTCFAQHKATITIIHYNDYHAQYSPLKIFERSTDGKEHPCFVGGAVAFKSYLDSLKHADSNSIVVNAGDNFQGTPISSMTNGWADIQMLNLFAPDIVALGNHEFDYSVDTLRKQLPFFKMPVISANLWDVENAKSFVQPWIVEKIGNVNIAFIGLVPPNLSALAMSRNIRGLKVLDLGKTVHNTIDEIKKTKHPQLIVLVSHIGYEMDSTLATSESRIDIIIGGHSHTAIFKPKKIGHTLICQAGATSRYIGELKLSVDLDGDSVVTSNGRLIEVKDDRYPANPVVKKIVDSLEDVANSKLNIVIGKLLVPWKRNSYHESNIGNWHVDALRKYAKTDIAIINSGSLRKDLPPGDITIRDEWEINPFGDELMTFEVSGSQLRSMMECQLAKTREQIEVSGMHCEYDGTKPGGHRILKLAVNGLSVKDKNNYSIVVNSFVADHLQELFGIPEKSIQIQNLGIIDRDVFIEEIKHQKNIANHVERRLVNVGDTDK